MADDVQWANGIDGGNVYGHAGVKEYWQRLFKVVSSHVTSLEIEEAKTVIKIKGAPGGS
jgi:hypothetical protein